MSKPYYMHTIDGKPAYYSGHDIVFLFQGSQSHRVAKLATSLDQIKAEQKFSQAWRNLRGYKKEGFSLGWVKVSIPEGEDE